ncbi:threonyl-tRNA synthetase /Ser-tRNA(Thr) hydrolase [Cryptobacterium curtum DSM 15641]|uniref:Threonine--tRNA ligase n=1 Tax=Cryptobacterium curtum (strain ATCC 700683 / DSM 15641 / CCUG 43107 / 12-3) TaxID=469378 RepID=C7MMM8_CRYCD|nr:threonine--tRNA ligase [Cryptobacterium curtum]ACU94168.1 threonyl-tRNA synthetase /Ser-tRNA(Thr) hydrolase [Cryptobacterium curtum DSM 15641]
MKVLYNDGHIDECPEDEELHVLRHSAAHILAQAVKRLYPEARFGYGPANDNGFYYDIDLGDAKISEDDLPTIEAEIKKIVKENLKFTVFELPREEAVKFMTERGESYKAEHIGDLPEDTRLTFYQQGEYVDMCVGPHITYTKALKAFKLTNVSGAYWKGDAANKMLTRIGGVAFRTKEELVHHEELLAEAEKRDHRKIGREMELFMMADEGPGFPFWLPNGMRLKNALTQYWMEMQEAYGYEQVDTPIILSRKLWETSGHWDHYKENMYTTVIDDEDYAVKPMNCPGACLIYKSKPRSYRDLPLKLAEAGKDHRHELKGALHGLFRVRAFTQDDAHLFIRPDQITEQVTDTAHLITAYYEQFGFPYRVELSTRPDDSMGSDEDWALAEEGLRQALEAMGVDYTLNEGDGAFYGPKIDFHLQDCLGRTWQCGTIQLDFQLPQNFELEYTDSDGSKKRPILIHRAGFGSFERFIGMLTEQYAGKFPTWLSPLQVKVLPVSEKHREYSRQIADKLRQAGVRVKVDERDEKIGYKIREARSVDRVPYMLILGEVEEEAGNISVRDRSNETVQRSLDDFITDIQAEISERR